MHKSYQSVQPTHNKLLQKRWDETYYNEHKRRIATVVPVVNTAPPKTYMHLHLKLKKLQVEEERLAVVERDNRMLLEKMAFVMRTRGRLDNQNSSASDYRSLNREKRERELLRVAKENQEVLRRILQKRADYDNVQLQKSWQQNLKYMDNLSSYPNRWWTMSRSGTRASNISRSGKRSGLSDRPLLPPIKSGSLSARDDNIVNNADDQDFDASSPPFASDAIPTVTRNNEEELRISQFASSRISEYDQEIESTVRIEKSDTVAPGSGRKDQRYHGNTEQESEKDSARAKEQTLLDSDDRNILSAVSTSNEKVSNNTRVLRNKEAAKKGSTDKKVDQKGPVEPKDSSASGPSTGNDDSVIAVNSSESYSKPEGTEATSTDDQTTSETALSRSKTEGEMSATPRQTPARPSSGRDDSAAQKND